MLRCYLLLLGFTASARLTLPFGERAAVFDKNTAGSSGVKVGIWCLRLMFLSKDHG